MASIFETPLSVIGLLVLLILELLALRALGDRVTGRILGAVSQAGPGKRLMLYVVLAPGVALHELAHAFAALVTGSGLAKVVLFKPERADNGVIRLGYVQPRYQPKTFVGEAFISFAPLLLPPLSVYLAAPPFIHGIAFGAMPQVVFEAAFKEIWNPLHFVWLFLFFSMTLSSFPSDTDFRVLGWKLLPVAALLLAPFAIYLVDGGASNLLLPYFVVFLFLLPSLGVAVAAVVVMDYWGGIRRTTRR